MKKNDFLLFTDYDYGDDCCCGGCCICDVLNGNKLFNFSIKKSDVPLA
jgi:hypothetical protein